MSFNPVNIGSQLEETPIPTSKFLFENDTGFTKRTTLNDIQFGPNVKLIYSESDLPPLLNGFHQLEQFVSYIFMKSGIIINSPISIPAGYIGYLENTFLDANGVIYTGVTDPFINTIYETGSITIADSITDPGNRLLITTTHALVNGQYVNITDATDVSYNTERLLVSNVIGTTSFEVPALFTTPDSGNFNTGYQALQFRNFVTASATSSTICVNLTSDKDDNSSLTILNSAFFGYTSFGILDKARNVFINGCLFGLISTNFILSNSDGINIDNCKFIAFAGIPGLSGIEIVGNETTSIGLSNNNFEMLASSQFAIKIDTNVTNAKFIRISNCPDNDVVTDYFDPTGLDETNPQIIANSNGSRKNSMTVSEIRNNVSITANNGEDVEGPIANVTPNAGDFIQDPSTEEYSLDDTVGKITYIGLKPIIAQVKYQFDAAATTGNNQTIVFRLKINGNVQLKATRTKVVPSSGVPVSFIGNFLLNPNDEIQLFMENTTNVTSTEITDLILLVDLG